MMYSIFIRTTDGRTLAVRSRYYDFIEACDMASRIVQESRAIKDARVTRVTDSKQVFQVEQARKHEDLYI
jgi:hypothetical protein